MQAAPRISSVACAALLVCSSLIAQANWNALSTLNAPAGRTGHAMAYDPIRDRIVLFGGNLAGIGFQNDTWEYDGSNWTQLFPNTVPPARAGHPMAYDPIIGRCVMYGGIPIGGGALNDTWVWDGIDWAQLVTPTNPPPKRSQTMAYDPTRGLLVMWGGYDGLGDTSDTWVFNGFDWSQVVTSNAPVGRRASDMAFDPTSGGMILFSGYQQGADTWLFDGLNWVSLAPVTIPPARYDHTMSTDFVRNRIVMFGGNTLGDTWEWTGTDWVQRAPTVSPPARFDDYLVWDSLRERTVMFGGLTGNPDLWEYRTPNPATFTTFGAGCPGSNHVAPALVSSDRPWIGEPFEVAVTGILPSAAVFMYIGFSNTNWSGIPLPFPLGSLGMPGCSLLVEPTVAPQIANIGGQGRITLTIPNRPGLVGLNAYYQAITADFLANAFGAVVSDGATLHISVK